MEDKWHAAKVHPSGRCMCGCGRKTKIVTKSDRRHGHVMGQPFRFIHGHSRPAEKGPNRFKLRRRTAVIFLASVETGRFWNAYYPEKIFKE